MTIYMVMNAPMPDIPLADAKAHLSSLVDRALHGESVRITRRGKPVVALTAVTAAPRPIDLAALQALTAAMPAQPEPARTWLRTERDTGRY